MRPPSHPHQSWGRKYFQEGSSEAPTGSPSGTALMAHVLVDRVLLLSLIRRRPETEPLAPRAITPIGLRN